jgi:hypothetical protein
MTYVNVTLQLHMVCSIAVAGLTQQNIRN